MGATANGGSARRDDPGPRGHPPGRVLDKENAMSLADKAKHRAEELKGKGKEVLGRATGDDELKTEGKIDQAKGRLKQAGERIKEIFK